MREYSLYRYCMEITRENLLAEIRRGLIKNSFSMNELEVKAQVPKDTVRDFIRGKTYIPRADKWQKLSRTLHIEHMFSE